MIRVTGGAFKGRGLKTPPGEITRPALSSVRLAVFNILSARVEGSRFLDLFGGSGAYAIEAISRGAIAATVIDINRKAIEIIRSNVQALGLGDRITVIPGDALNLIAQLASGDQSFDIIAVAPPHFAGLVAGALKRLDEHPNLLAEGGVIFVQHHRNEPLPQDLTHFEPGRSYSYGTTQISLIHAR